MSAPTIVTETFIQNEEFTIQLAEALHKKYPNTPPAMEIINDPELTKFFKKTIKEKKVKNTIEERRGVYDGERCDARVWHYKVGSGGLGYDDIQCNHKKHMNECFCKKHAKMYNEGKLWTGKITEPRPENPVKTDGTTMHWCTDNHGNDVMKKKTLQTKKKKKNDSPVKVQDKSPNDMSIEELIGLLKEKEKEETTNQEEDGEEGGIGAGVGFDEDISPSSPTELCNDIDQSEEEETFIIKSINGCEYQINTEDNTVIHLEEYEIVGLWNKEEGKIIFNEEE